MKKIIYIALISLTALVSCSKETDDPTQNQPQEQTEEPAVTPEQPADLPEGMIQLTFSVNPEETKTSWDGTTHGWSEGDQVRILWGEGESDFVDAAVENGQVTAVVADVGEREHLPEPRLPARRRVRRGRCADGGDGGDRRQESRDGRHSADCPSARRR